MLHYPTPAPSSSSGPTSTPDTIDIWPALALIWALLWSVCRILAQRHTVTALSTPLHVTKGLEDLRHIGPAIGVVVGDLVTWLILLSLMTVDMLYAQPFYSQYLDSDGTGSCPTWMGDRGIATMASLTRPPPEGPLVWYCANAYQVTANLELAGLVLCSACIICHLACFGIGCAEVHRRRLGRQVGGGTGRSDVELRGLTAGRTPGDPCTFRNQSRGQTGYEEKA